MKIIRILSAGVLAASLIVGIGSAAQAAVYSSDGRPLLKTFDEAGTGEFDEMDGAADEASFRHPSSVAVRADGSLLVSDTGNHRIRLVRGDEVSVYAGIQVSVLFDDAGLPMGAFNNGPKDLSLFWSPAGIDIDAIGNVYVADRDNHAIRKISRTGAVTTVAGNGVLGHADGHGAKASFYAPSDVAVADDGTIYVADTLNHAIRKIAPTGAVTTLNKLPDRATEIFDGVIEFSGDFTDGALSEALFNEPAGLELDSKGNLYVSDSGNQRIRYIDFEAGTVTTVAGGGKLEENALYVEGFLKDGPALEARFYSPKGIALDREGGLYIADSLNHSVRYLKDGNVMTVVGGADGENGAYNGTEKKALLDFPTDVAIGRDGSLYVADLYNNKIRKIAFYDLPAGWAANGDIRVLLETEEVKFDALPEIQSDRTMVPVRQIAEKLGYDVTYEGEKVILAGEGGTIELTYGERSISRTSNGVTRTESIDAAPYEKQGSTYIPIRFFAEQIGLDVSWHTETTTVIIRK